MRSLTRFLARAPEWNDLPKLSYTLQVINESMRLFPVVYSIAREFVEDDDIAVAMITQSFRLSCADDAPVEASARITLTPTRDFSLRLELRR
jgi:hypothetical protein